MRLTKNFSLNEYDCKNGKVVPKKYIHNAIKNAVNLQVLRDYYNLPVIIISGYRNRIYNFRVGGAFRSKHLIALASDIRISGKNPYKIYSAIEKLIASGNMEEGGLGLYNTFVHYDPRGNKARWNNSNFNL